MAFTVTLRNGVSNTPEFMEFIDPVNKIKILFNKPTFKVFFDGSVLTNGYIQVFENGVLHPVSFSFSDFYEIEGDTPGSMEHVHQLLCNIRTLMV